MTKPLLVIGNKNYSSWSLRAWLVASKAGVDFEEKRIPLDTPEFESTIATYSPTRRVPVFHDQGLVVWDSLAIAEYLNETYANHTLWPGEAKTRAIARSVTTEMHSGFATLRHRMPMNIRARDRVVDSSPALDADIARITSLWQQCREFYGAAGNWMFGAFSIADAFFAPVVFRFITYGVPLSPVAQTYVDWVQADAEIQVWVQAAQAEVETVEAEEVGGTPG